MLYFFRFDVGNEGAYSIFAAVAFAAQVLVMMVIPPVSYTHLDVYKRQVVKQYEKFGREKNLLILEKGKK